MVINSVFEPIVNVSMETFLQTKVPPDLQGRVFSASDFIVPSLNSNYPTAGRLFGDRIFEPAMRRAGLLSSAFGWLVGTGPGSGFGLLILLCGIGGIDCWDFGIFCQEIRNLDQIRQITMLHHPVDW